MSFHEEKVRHRKSRPKKIKAISVDPFIDPNLDNLINNSDQSNSIDPSQPIPSTIKSNKIQQATQPENNRHNRIVHRKQYKPAQEKIQQQVFKEEYNSSNNKKESQENVIDTSNFEIDSSDDEKNSFSIEKDESSDNLMEELPTVINVKKNNRKGNPTKNNKKVNDSDEDDEGESIPILGGNKNKNNPNINEYYSDNEENENQINQENDYYSDSNQEDDNEDGKNGEYSYEYDYEYEYETENVNENETNIDKNSITKNSIGKIKKNINNTNKNISNKYNESKNDQEAAVSNKPYNNKNMIQKENPNKRIRNSYNNNKDEIIKAKTNVINSTTENDDYYDENDLENNHIKQEANDNEYIKNENNITNEANLVENVSDDEYYSENDNDNNNDDTPIYSSQPVPEKYHFESFQQLNRIINSRFYSLIKTGKKHFPATKDNQEVILRLIDQSRACHEFHFLENRCKYFEKENMDLKLGSSKKPKKMSDVQQKEAKRLSKELLEAKKRIEALSSFGNQSYANNDNSLFDEVDNLKLENQVILSKEKENVARIQRNVDDLQKQVDDYEKRINLMTQKKSNYSVKNLIKKEKKRQKEKNEELKNEMNNFIKSSSILGDTD